ncbi:hypothetical protein GCM10023189_05890 [Nibrella saemangeumensis]|uniref:Amidohydrolase-related domain-containing protein n=1 Tax=Nibrella saemangeumensis TaxID=1084526 RepID=A0ABP8MEQ7_9BACT
MLLRSITQLNRFSCLCLFFIASLLLRCYTSSHAQTSKTTQPESYYSLDDFKTVEKFDTHVHLNTTNPALIEQAAEDKFRLLTINVDAPTYPAIDDQQRLANQHRKAFPNRLAYATTFSVENWTSNDWSKQAISYIKNSVAQGAIGVKVWKNVGMTLRDNTGKFVMVDNPRFDPLFDYLAKNKIPLLGHLGEPKNCWLPLDQMTVKSNRDYYTKHPEYHMYLHPEYPSYEAHIQARDRMLAKHPDLRFIGVHLASLEWSVDEIAKRLDRFPNMAIDMSARMAHLQYQAITDWQKVHDFLIKYQDRILYATDIAVDQTATSADTRKRAHDTWLRDWRFLTSADVMTVPSIEGSFKAMRLPRSVVDKLYSKNAQKWLLGITTLTKGAASR